MTALTLGFTPGSPTTPAAAALVEFQITARVNPKDLTGERWVVHETMRWDIGASHLTIVDDVIDVVASMDSAFIFDRTDMGEEYADLFRMARRHGRLKLTPLGALLTAGQVPSDVGFPRAVLVHRFGAKLSSERLVVAPTAKHAKELEAQLRRFQNARRKAATADDVSPEDLALAVMLATAYKRYQPGQPRYVSRTGKTYFSQDVSPDPY